MQNGAKMEEMGSERRGSEEILELACELDVVVNGELLGTLIEERVGKTGGVFSEELAHGGAQHLTTHGKGGLDDTTEEGLVAIEMGATVAPQGDYGTLYFWRGIEDGGRDGEEVVDIVPELDEDREYAIGATAVGCGESLCHFALYHSRAEGNAIAVLHESEEDLGGDIVGIVACEHEGLPLEE